MLQSFRLFILLGSGVLSLKLKMLYQGTWSHFHKINNNNNNNRLALSMTITNQNTVLQKLFITYY